MRGGRKREDFAEIVDYFAQRAPGAAALAPGISGEPILRCRAPFRRALFGDNEPILLSLARMVKKSSRFCNIFDTYLVILNRGNSEKEEADLEQNRKRGTIWHIF